MASQLRQNPMFGPHVSRVHASGVRPDISDHIETARREAEIDAAFRVTAASIFVGGPRDRKINLEPAEVAKLGEYVSRTGLKVVAHNSYSAAPWRGDPDAAKFIREEAKVCQAAGVFGLVVHLPKLPVAGVMKYISRLVEPEAADVRVYLEIPAVRPHESYYETPEKLTELFGAIRGGPDAGLRHFGLCVDTAHLHTCGVDLRTYGEANAWLEALEAASDVIPHDVVVLHINDSARPLGAGPDAHAPLAQGRIWGEFRGRLGESGLAAFTDYAQRHGTVSILERKPREALLNDYRVLRELVPSAQIV